MECIEERGQWNGQIAFIDPNLEAWETLATGTRKGIEVIILDPLRDAIEQITATLKGRSGVEAVHIISHGSPGTLHLGNTTLDRENLDRYAALLQSWQPIQNPKSKIQNLLLYGCQVAAGEIGRAFLEKLHQLTGANIAASSSLVGNWRLGGNWELKAIGNSAAETAFSATAMAAYPGIFALDFNTQTTYGAGDRPVFVAVGNFNGDGAQDLVVANNDSYGSGYNVSVLLADGSGGFEPQTTFEVGVDPRSVAVEDFNGDNIPDLAVANRSSNNVSVLLGDGSGSFGTQTTFGGGGEDLAVGDFDRDGTPDLAVANFNFNTVSVLLGDGSGSFGTQTTFGTGRDPFSVAVDDFNGDGSPDLALANFQDANVSVLLGDGSGSFSTQTTFGTGTQPTSVAVEDFNGDNIPDLAVATRSSANVSVLLGDGSGSFGTQMTFGAGGGPYSVAVGDFNGDSSPDLALANYGSDNISVLLGDGSGSFGTQMTFGTGNGPFSVAVGDFNGDGKLDLAVANEGASTVSVLLNTVVLSTPIVSITPGTTGDEAGPSNGTFDITLDSPAPTGGLTVNFNVSGSTATDPADYSLTAGANITGITATTFTIAAGETSATLNVVPIDDSEIESGAETVNVNLAGGSDYFISSTDNTATVTITDNDFSEIEVTESGTSIADAGNFDFGNTTVGSNTVKAFTITNSGNADLTLGAETLTGTGYSLIGSFPSANIAAGSSTTFDIQLDASSAGTFNGNLSFVNGDNDENPYDISLTGTVTGPEVEVRFGSTNIADGDSFDFGRRIVGSNVVKTFTITNNGNADLALGTETLTGTGYSLVGTFPTANIAAGSSTTFQIQLDSSSPGTFNGNLSFVNGDNDENPYDVSLTGTVTAPEIEVSDGANNIADGTTAALDFGSTVLGTPISKSFTIENTGDADLSISNLSLPAGFSLVGDLPASIAPGSSDSLEIQLDGSAGGSFNGTISFENNDADENSFDFAVSGTVASNPPVVANSVFSQGFGFRSGQFSFAADSYADPDPGDSVTYSIALANTLPLWDWARGTNGSEYAKPREGIVFPEVPMPSWLSFNPATRTLNINEATRPNRFRYWLKVTGTDRSGESVSEFVRLENSILGRRVIDNYIAGATVFWDANKNGIQDAGEPSTTSDQTGEFDLDISIRDYDTGENGNNNGILDPAEGQIVAFGGIDTATGLPLETPVVSTPDATVVTLLTTLVADLANKGLPVNDANQLVVTALSLPPGVDINVLDPIAATENNEVGGTETLAAMVKVQNVITQTASLVDGASNAEFNLIVQNVVGAITSQIQSGGTLDVSNSATLETIINDAAVATQQNDPNIDLTQVQAIASGAAQVTASSNQQVDALIASGASGATLTAETANIQKVTLGNVTEELEAAAEGTKDIALVVAQNTGAALSAKINTPGLTFASPVSLDTPPRPSLPTLSANIELVINDATEGTDSDDTYIGDSSDNSYLAYSGNDILFGNGGSDWMNGNRGDDSLDGGNGNDTLYGGKDNDTISGNNGADVIFGNRGNDRLLGNNGDDFLNGNQAEDILFGGNGNDMLHGGKQNDTLNGGDGSDTLSGDLGNDILTGGNGSDRFVLKAGYGSDILTDFEDGQDFLALADGLTFGQLAIAGENGSTLIRLEGELLATLENVDVSLISSGDFLAGF